MPVTTFDTHKYVRRLQDAGMPLGQAEVHVELLSEAFAVNLENLVTRDYFDAKLGASLAEHDAATAVALTRVHDKRLHVTTYHAAPRFTSGCSADCIPKTAKNPQPADISY